MVNYNYLSAIIGESIAHELAHLLGLQHMYYNFSKEEMKNAREESVSLIVKSLPWK